jgi:flagellar motor protein MotB
LPCWSFAVDGEKEAPTENSAAQSTSWRVVNLDALEDHWNIGQLQFYASDDWSLPLVSADSVAEVICSHNYSDNDLSVLYDGDWSPLGHAEETVWAGNDEERAMEPRGSWVGYRFNSKVTIGALKIAQMAEGYPGFQSSKRLLVEFLDENGEWQEYVRTEAPTPVAMVVLRTEVKVASLDGNWKVRWLNGDTERITVRSGSYECFGTTFTLNKDGCSITWPSDGTVQTLQGLGGDKLLAWRQEQPNGTLTWSTTNAEYPTIYWDPEAGEEEKRAAAEEEQEVEEKAEEEAKKKADGEAKEKAKQEAKEEAEQEAKKKAEQETKKKAEQEAKEKAEQEKAEEEAKKKKKAEEEAKEKAKQEAKATGGLTWQLFQEKAEQEAKEVKEGVPPPITSSSGPTTTSLKTKEVVVAIECGVAGNNKWGGIAAVGSKLYCAPYNASSVLVIDADADKISMIECGVAGGDKWRGIAAVGSKLYCAPHYASSVLVIDAETGTVSTIECGVAGNCKWFGIAAVGSKLYCAPYNASSVLVIDVETDKVSTIECGVIGNYKWCGIAAVGSKLYCAPFKASSVLVIDAETNKVSTIECSVPGHEKWRGIAALGSKLYCGPFKAS